MKFNIEIDCSPEEARHFLGLPDIAPMQQRLLEMMEERMREAATKMDAGEMLEQWLPLGMKGMEQWQSLWSQMAKTAAGMQPPADKPGGKKGGA